MLVSLLYYSCLYNFDSRPFSVRRTNTCRLSVLLSDCFVSVADMLKLRSRRVGIVISSSFLSFFSFLNSGGSDIVP